MYNIRRKCSLLEYLTYTSFFIDMLNMLLLILTLTIIRQFWEVHLIVVSGQLNLGFEGVAETICRKFVFEGKISEDLNPLTLDSKVLALKRVYFQHVTKAGGSTLGLYLPVWLSELGRVVHDSIELRRNYVSFDKKHILKLCKRCTDISPRGSDHLRYVSKETGFFTTQQYIEQGYYAITMFREPLQRCQSSHLHFLSKSRSYGNRCGWNAEEFVQKCCGARPACNCRSCSYFQNFQVCVQCELFGIEINLLLHID